MAPKKRRAREEPDADYEMALSKASLLSGFNEDIEFAKANMHDRKQKLSPKLLRLHHPLASLD